jgi:hypothetical protein
MSASGDLDDLVDAYKRVAEYEDSTPHTRSNEIEPVFRHKLRFKIERTISSYVGHINDLIRSIVYDSPLVQDDAEAVRADSQWLVETFRFLENTSYNYYYLIELIQMLNNLLEKRLNTLMKVAQYAKRGDSQKYSKAVGKLLKNDFAIIKNIVGFLGLNPPANYPPQRLAELLDELTQSHLAVINDRIAKLNNKIGATPYLTENKSFAIGTNLAVELNRLLRLNLIRHPPKEASKASMTNYVY